MRRSSHRLRRQRRRLDNYDVAVIGAGAAGLLAARELARAGRSVVLIEATDRAGGRMRSIADPQSLGPIELGPEFVHGRPWITYGLLHEFGSTTIDDADDLLVLRNGALERTTGDPFADTTALLARALERDDESVDASLARVASEARLRQSAVWARRLVAGFDAADPARASARAIAREWTSDASADGAQSRPVGGYAPLVQHLARCVDDANVAMRFETVVTRVVRDATGVTIEASDARERHSFRASRAIVTIPIGVLRASSDARGAIAFDPPLPAATLRAIDRIEMGPVVKVVLRFATAFWEKLDGGAFRDAAFFNTDDAFPTFWTQLPLRATTLVAWAGGPVADALAGCDESEAIEVALACAGRMFGAPDRVRAEFGAGYVHDWQRDPFARGAYSYVLVGGENARADLALPVGERVWFAGEATASEGEGGTVAGALESGLRAAREILRFPFT